MKLGNEISTHLRTKGVFQTIWKACNSLHRNPGFYLNMRKSNPTKRTLSIVEYLLVLSISIKPVYCASKVTSVDVLILSIEGKPNSLVQISNQKLIILFRHTLIRSFLDRLETRERCSVQRIAEGWRTPPSSSISRSMGSGRAWKTVSISVLLLASCPFGKSIFARRILPLLAFD